MDILVNRGRPQLSLPGKGISLIMRGVGTDSAFAWGSLDRLLEEPTVRVENVFATGAGALNAVAFAYGLAAGGRQGAKQALSNLWRRVSHAAPFEHPNELVGRPRANDLVLRHLIEQVVDFERLRAGTPVNIFLSMIRGNRDSFHVVANRKITIDDVITAFHAPWMPFAVPTGCIADPAIGHSQVSRWFGSAYRAVDSNFGYLSVATMPAFSSDWSVLVVLRDAGRQFAQRWLDSGSRVAGNEPSLNHGPPGGHPTVAPPDPRMNLTRPPKET